MNWQNLLKKFKNFWLFAMKSFKKFIEYKGDINVFWYKNIFYYENTRHRFHLVSPSPWPLFASLAASSLLIGLLFWIHSIVIGEQFHHPFFLGFIIVSIIMFVWFRDIIREGIYLGYHTKIVQKGLKIGFILFLVSEIMFFFCLFWAYFHSSLNPSIWIGGIWPPEGIIHFYINDSFDTLFNLFYRLNEYNSAESRFNLATSDVSAQLITSLKHSEHVYLPTYDPTACFDRVYLFYQNMFFYSPNGRVPLTYNFFFESRLHEHTYMAELRRDFPELVDKNVDNYRIGSAFNYYYSKPLFVSNGISSKDRFKIEKYIFFMFFIKEILRESSIYTSFLDLNLLDVSKAENFLTKKYNTIFLNLFYKFYQAPAVINYWTFQNSLEKDVFLYPKTFGSDNLIFNERSLGEPFVFSWPAYYFNSSALSRRSKHGLNWYLYNNMRESNLPNWSDYFVSFFNNYTFHFLDTFYDNPGVSKKIGKNYNNLSIDFCYLQDTSIYHKIMRAKLFFAPNKMAHSDYEARYFLENYDILFNLQIKERLKTDNSNILNNNQFLTNNLLFMSDLGFIDQMNFNKVSSLENSTIKKIFAIMFKKFSRHQYMLHWLILFFSNKNIQIQLKHFYADMDEDLYTNSPKLLNFLSTAPISLNLAVSESKIFNFGKYFKFYNTLDNNLYKDYYFESDPLIVGAKIYNKIFKCFSYKSDLYNDYDYRWFLMNVTFDKLLDKNLNFSNYDFLNKNFSSHKYALANLIIVTEAIASPSREDESCASSLIPSVAGIRFFYNIINCFQPGYGLFPLNSNEKIDFYDRCLSFPLILFDNYWFAIPSTLIYFSIDPNFEFNNFGDEEFLNFDVAKLDWNKGRMDKNIFATFYVFKDYNKYVLNSFEFFNKLKSRSAERFELFSNFINQKLELYYSLYDIYMGGMSIFTGRYMEHPFKRFDNIYFVLSVFDKGLLIDPNKVPWINTIILITSGLAVTVSHVYFKAGYRYFSLFFLALTIALSCFFLKIQMLEYIHASFSMNDGVYGSVFYMLTGFHGFHVLVGTAFLTVCFFRILLKHFLSSRHIAFEFAIWYWHFVDVIWIGLYFFVYYWPNNYFFYYHRIWQNSEEFTTDGFSHYLCMMQYPLSEVSDYIILGKREDFVPHLRHWITFKKFDLSKKDDLLNHNRKLMALCKYDRFQRQNLIASVFINHSTTYFFYNWDAYYYGERFLTKKSARDYELWWFWEDFSRYFRQEFRDYWRPWWFLLMEIFFTGKAINPSVVRRTTSPYWE